MSRDRNETKFSYRAFRDLKKGLGTFDAVVECNELSIREFLENLKLSTDKDEYVQKLSEKHKIKVDTVNTNIFSSRIRLFYIMSVMQRAEQFLDEFKNEYKSYGHTWTNKVDGETDLDNLLMNLFGSTKNGISEIGKEVYQGYEYYRLIRNRFAHSEEKDSKRLASLFKKVVGNKEFYGREFHSIDSPNKYEDVTINDFLLITNIIKNIGWTLGLKCKPSNEEISKKIESLEIESNGKIIKPIMSIKKLLNKPQRFKNAVGNLLNTFFRKDQFL